MTAWNCPGLNNDEVELSGSKDDQSGAAIIKFAGLNFSLLFYITQFCGKHHYGWRELDRE